MSLRTCAATSSSRDVSILLAIRERAVYCPARCSPLVSLQRVASGWSCGTEAKAAGDGAPALQLTAKARRGRRADVKPKAAGDGAPALQLTAKARGGRSADVKAKAAGDGAPALQFQRRYLSLICPLLGGLAETRPDGVVSNIVPLGRIRLVVAQEVVEELRLP